MFNGVDGIYLYGVTKSNISNTMTAHNQRGMSLIEANNSYIDETTAVYNNLQGIYLDIIDNIQIAKTTAIYNNLDGIFLGSINNVQISNTTAVYNESTEVQTLGVILIQL